jgi:hypothetical protein
MHTYIFDRKTGKFEYELGRYGRGPGEYQTSFIAFNYTDLIVYSIGWKNNMLMYKLDGRYLGNFSIPFQKGGMEDPSLISRYCDFQNSNIVGYSLNILGTETKLLTIFNQKGEVIKVFPNKNIYPKRPLKSIDLTEGKFFRFGNNTFFKEKCNDTVFKVTDKSLIPHIIFEMGNYSVPYKYKWWTPEERQKSNFIFVNDIFENNAWIYILVNNKVSDFFVLFNKKTLKLSINKNGEGIPNDIDNFVKFKPELIDSEGNLVAVVSALEINKWFKDNSSKISDAKIGLQNIEITQNPVFMIGKTKNN